MKLKKGIMIIISIILLITLLGSIYYLWSERNDRNNAINSITDLRNKAIVESVDNSFVDVNLLRRVDFNYLQGINSEASRWIYVPGTKIDSVVMQESVVGRYKYDLRDINNKYNGSGTFLMPAQPIDEDTGEPAKDAHTLILGHRMNSRHGEWQFSELPIRWGNIEGTYDYPYIYVYYPDRAEKWRIWAGTDAYGNDMMYNIPYEIGSDEYQSLLDHIGNSSRYQTIPQPDKFSEILVLSTCNYTEGEERFHLTSVLDSTYYYDTNNLVSNVDLHSDKLWRMNNQSVRDDVLYNVRLREREEELSSSVIISDDDD